MSGLRFGRPAVVEGVVRAGLVLLLVTWAAACGDDDSDTGSEDADAPAGVSSDMLGEPNPASGTPVKVGMITDGGDCAECSATAGDEQPATEATVEWVNEYLHGLGGHPIDLAVCVDDLDPAKASDCANQMIADDVVAVVIGSSGVIESSWGVLHDAGVPVVNFSATQPALLEDDASTFILQDPDAITVNFPLEVAQDTGAEVVSIVVVDLPIATDAYGDDTENLYEEAGVELDVVPVPLGVPDMTPQMQEVVSNNPDGLVMIVGHDQFCIPAINGLTSVGFSGTIATISNCVTDAMRDAIPGDVLDGMVLAAPVPIGDDEDATMQQYHAVLDEYGASDVDRTGATPVQMFASFAALGLGTQALEGDVTPESLIAALRAMPSEVLPAGGGRHFRCDGTAAPHGPAICTSSLLSATLDADGTPSSYEVLNDVQAAS